MKIAMATEYFWPHDQGGSEWSTYYQAQYLINHGHEVIVITPNYNSKTAEVWKGIKIIRFPFIKMKNDNGTLSPFWHTNLFWITISAFYLIKICFSEKINVLHVQGKYFSPAAFLSRLILKVPAIITVRDYQLICNYGFCIWHKNRSCNFKEYFSNDFIRYYDDYVSNHNLITLMLNIVFALRARLITKIYSYFAKKLDRVVCISHAQAKIYKSNGFDNLSVIYNPMKFEKINDKTKTKTIIYAGRLTPGKGLGLLFSASLAFFKVYPKYKLLVIGEGFLKSSLKEFVKKNNIQQNIIFMGKITHHVLLKHYSKAIISIVPSIWPEPFGRSALESLSQGTPSVVTNRGGLPEIVVNGKIGFVCKTNLTDFTKKLIQSIEQNKKLYLNIKKNYKYLKNKFEKENNQMYIDLYKSLI